MTNRPDPVETDIAEERYDGPTAAIVAAGNGVFEHLKWAGILLGSGVAVAALFPRSVASFLTHSRDLATRLKSHESEQFGDIAKRSFGKMIHSLVGDTKAFLSAEEIQNLTAEHKEWLEHTIMNREHGFGHWFTTHTVGIIPKVGRYFKNTLLAASREPVGTESARWTNALTFGGMFGALGYAGGWVWAVFHGTRHGSDGKHQLLRAQQEIKDTRELNALLEERYIATKQENIDLKTTLAAQQGTLHVARDEKPTMPPSNTAALLDQADAENPVEAAPIIRERHVKHTPEKSQASRDPIRQPPENREWVSDVKAARDLLPDQPARA